MSEVTISNLPISENQHFFCQMIEDVLAEAKRLGASDGAAQVSAVRRLSVSGRKQQPDTVEQARERCVGITVYDGQKRGTATTADFTPTALREAVAAAWHIARYTAEDPAAGLPEADDLAFQYPDLALYRPWSIDAEQATEWALRAERAALNYDSEITNSEGASVDSLEGHFVLGNTRGFLGGYPYSRHSIGMSPIAGVGEQMQRDYWYSVARAAHKLDSPEEVGRIAAQRTLSRLHARSVPTGRYPVIFEAPLAAGLIGAFVRANSGGALYRGASFLQGALGERIFPEHVQLLERPHLKGGLGSAPFDGEGVATHSRVVIQQGELQGHFLSSYTARKLGLKTTGNADGAHNLLLRSQRTQPHHSLDALLKEMGTGLLVTELIGQGINFVTGDYSRGAFGYWVENGQIQYPVQGITIAGNLRDMFRQIALVGHDRLVRGGRETGSILIEEMAIAGH